MCDWSMWHMHSASNRVFLGSALRLFAFWLFNYHFVIFQTCHNDPAVSLPKKNSLILIVSSERSFQLATQSIS